MTRSGYIALVGRPNVGKSTLLNALIGEKLSIVTPRAQTTREAVQGILTTDAAQIVFVDTPGLLEPRYTLQRAMLEWAIEAIHDADVTLLLLDATRPDELPVDPGLAAIRSRADRLVVAVNKVDAAEGSAVRALTEWSEHELDQRPLLVSALRGDSVAELRDRLIAELPEGPFLFPEDEIATQSVRFFVTEMIRETIFEEYGQEVPYATAVRIEEFREADEPVYIRATVYVERDTQKQILIGRGGAGIRTLGQRSREKIETFLDTRVYLDLWVKALPNWRKKPGTLKYLGYRVPRADEPGAEKR